MTVLPPRCLCLVTDRRRATPDARTLRDEIVALEAWLDDAIEAGIDLIQIRERDLNGSALVALAARVARRATGTATRVLVNDRCDVAIGAGAAGVHVRDDGPPVDRVRVLAPPGWMIGRSVHHLDTLAQQAAASYFIFGTVFATASKGPGARVQGIVGLRAAVAATSIPVLAIGGMDVANARTCIDAGAAGIAAIGLFLPESREAGARGVARAVQEIKHA